MTLKIYGDKVGLNDVKNRQTSHDVGLYVITVQPIVVKIFQFGPQIVVNSGWNKCDITHKFLKTSIEISVGVSALA